VAETKSTGYQLGRALEYRVRDQLQADGYFVIRAAASKGPADLVAIKPPQILLVQCKRSGTLPPAEWNQLYDIADSLGAIAVMAVKGLRGTQLLRLTGRKDGTCGRRQPMEPFSTSAVMA
jgi:Holliday junction resolvase